MENGKWPMEMATFWKFALCKFLAKCFTFNHTQREKDREGERGERGWESEGHKVYPETDPSWLLPATFATDFIASAAAAAAVITKFHMQPEREGKRKEWGKTRRKEQQSGGRKREKCKALWLKSANKLHILQQPPASVPPTTPRATLKFAPVRLPAPYVVYGNCHSISVSAWLQASPCGF